VPVSDGWKGGDVVVTDLKFWTVAELAIVLRISKMSVYRLIHSGELGAQQFGRSFRVSDAAVAAYLATSKCATFQEGGAGNGHLAASSGPVAIENSSPAQPLPSPGDLS
jgi:excisionase family DNA binding protein